MLIDELIGFLGDYFAVHQYPANEQGGIYQLAKRTETDQPVKRIGVALEPWPSINNWVAEQQLDTVWLHRPWKLDANRMPPNVNILYHHLPFDETLTMGYSLRMAQTLLMRELEEIGHKQASESTGEVLPERAIGMIGQAPEIDPAAWIQLAEDVFGGYDRIEPGHHERINRVVVVGAMNDALIREAAERGAGLYLTGEYRKSAQKAVEETGMTVIAIGHRRSEEWGIRALAGVLRERWASLEVVTRT